MVVSSLTDSQWDQYEAWLAYLQPLSLEERAAELQRLSAQGEVEPPILEFLVWRLQRRPDPDRCRTGERIGSCTLGEALGAGGMGVVYRAQQHIGDATREVAVKLMHPRWLLTAREEAVARFRAEVRTLVTLEYEGIARIYDGGSDTDPYTQEPCLYIVMQLVPNALPITTYAQQCHLTVQQRLALFVKVCDAVREAHRYRIVHRDLKPANILVNSEEHPVVIDFGLARAYDALVPGAARVSGTLAYMSPERISPAFGEVSMQSDVYALGVILYELLTGHRPYVIPPHGSIEELHQIITEVQPPPLHQDLSKEDRGELDAILTAALAKWPKDRPTIDMLRSRINHYINRCYPSELHRDYLLAPQQRDRNQQLLLAAMKEDITDQLAYSLHKSVFLDLYKEDHSEQVERFGAEKIPFGHLSSEPIPPEEMGIVQLFQQAAGKLLILGAPGAGKTTMLLQLAEALVTRAEMDPAQPIPVIMHLSSWTDDYPAFASWLVATLKDTYKVPAEDSERWLNENSLVLLLDGLDALAATRQEACAQAINQFRENYRYRQTALVVCCRWEAYQHVEPKLHLRRAISLCHFTAEQIQRYLVKVEQPALWRLLQEHPDLLELAQTPLFLRVMTFALDERVIQAWRQSPPPKPEYPQRLFAMYIERMLPRDTTSQAYSREKTVHSLAWLATKLQEHAPQEFLLENIQPTWLSSPLQKWLYHGGVVVIVTLLVQLGRWLVDGLTAFGPPSALYSNLKAMSEHEGIPAHFWPYLELYGGWILPLIIGLLVGMRHAITPIETLKWSGAKAWQGVTSGLPRWGRLGLKYGSVGGLIIGLVVSVLLCLSQSSSTSLSPGSVSWVDVGKIGGLFAGLLAGVVAVMTALPRIGRWGEICERLAAQWPRAVLYGLLGGLGVGVGFGHEGWGNDPVTIVLMGLATGMIVGLSHGLSDRRVVRWADTLVVGLLGGVGGGLLSWGIGGMLLKVLPWELENWMHFWLFGGMGVGGAAGLVTGLRAKLREKAISSATLHASRRAGWLGLGLQGRQELTLAAGAAVVSGVLISVLAGVGPFWMVRVLAAFTYFLGWGLITTLIFCLLLTLGGAAIGAVPSVPGALFEALRGGLTGPESKRRTRPNQGIRQSTGNIGVFALVGGLTVGLLWGLLNMFGTGLMLGRAPQAGDWWHFVLGGVLLLGFLSGLIPGAACIQHFMLRFVLWCHGLMPWRYVRFLDYATERRLLQRVGGHYWCLHEMLRDHFAAMMPKQG